MATTGGEAVFIDTNVLVYASIPESPSHHSALNAIQSREQLGISLWISRQVLREFLATLTRPQTFAIPLEVSDVIAQIRHFETRFPIAEDGPHVTEMLLSLMGQIPIGGSQVHDANIVATMQAYGISHLLTQNVSDFARFQHLITILPI